MAEISGIAWTDSTFNPWIGCTKVSPGCDNCYAEQLDSTRFSKTLGGATKAVPIKHWGPGAPRHRTGPDNWEHPRQWNERAFRSGEPWRVFCASLADVFDNEVPASWHIRLFDLIRDTPALTWMLLTKRIGNVPVMLPPDWGDGWPNVWLGVTVVTQAEAERDIPKLRAIRAAKRFLSCEPLLEHIKPSLDGIDWVICGGESGSKARPFDLTWARSLRYQCDVGGAALFLKHVGALAIDSDTGCDGMVGRVIGIRDKAGADPTEWPLDLQIQEFP